MSARERPEDVIDVVWARPVGDAGLAALLDPAECARMELLRRRRDRELFVAAHALLRLVVAEWTGSPAIHLEFTAHCSRCGEPHGKPHLDAPPGSPRLHVSLAHAHGRALIAVTGAGPVGVDVESHAATGFEGFDEIALAAGEQRALPAEPAARARARAVAWVRKESALKAAGCGLLTDPADLVVSRSGEPAEVLFWEGPDRPADPVHLTDLAVGTGHAACVALISEHRVPVRLRDGNPLLRRASAACRESRQGGLP